MRIQKFFQYAIIKLVSDVNGTSAMQTFHYITANDINDIMVAEMAILAPGRLTQKSPFWNSPWKVTRDHF